MKKVMFLIVAVALLSAQVVVADVIVGYGQYARVYDEATWTPKSTEYNFGASNIKVVSSAFLPNGNVALSWTLGTAGYGFVTVLQPSATGAWTQLSESSNWGIPVNIDAMANGELLFHWSNAAAATFDPVTFAQTSADLNFAQWGYTVPDVAATYDGRILYANNIGASYGFVSIFSKNPNGTWHEDVTSQNLTPVLGVDSLPNGDVLATHNWFGFEEYVTGTPWTAPYSGLNYYPYYSVAEFAGMPDGRVVVAYNSDTYGYYLSTLVRNPDGTWHEDSVTGNFGIPITTVSAQRVVPEPGSLLALGSALTGLAGFVLRRRR